MQRQAVFVIVMMRAVFMLVAVAMTNGVLPPRLAFAVSFALVAAFVLQVARQIVLF